MFDEAAWTVGLGDADRRDVTDALGADEERVVAGGSAGREPIPSPAEEMGERPEARSVVDPVILGPATIEAGVVGNGHRRGVTEQRVVLDDDQRWFEIDELLQDPVIDAVDVERQ